MTKEKPKDKRPPRLAALASQENTRKIASELAIHDPPSPHTLPSPHTFPSTARSGSPTPDQQLERELAERGSRHSRTPSGGMASGGGNVGGRHSRTPSGDMARGSGQGLASSPPMAMASGGANGGVGRVRALSISTSGPASSPPLAMASGGGNRGARHSRTLSGDMARGSRQGPASSPPMAMASGGGNVGGNGGVRHSRTPSGGMAVQGPASSPPNNGSGGGTVRVRDSRTPSISLANIGPASSPPLPCNEDNRGAVRLRTPSMSTSTPGPAPTLTEQIMAINRKARGETTSQGKGQGQTKPSRIVKLPIPGRKMMEIFSSPPPSQQQPDNGTGSSTQRVKVHTRPRTQTVHSSPPPSAQMYSSPPQGFGFGSSPPLPQRAHQNQRRQSQSQSSPLLPQNQNQNQRRRAPSQSQSQSSPTYRGPGELHSSPPEVKVARARAEAQAWLNRPSTPQNSTVIYTNDTPPGFPPGFNDPRTNPTVPAFATASPQARQVLSIAKPLDPSRITVGLPQKEIDRVIKDPRKTGGSPKQASRQWAEQPPPAKKQRSGPGNLPLPSPTTAQLQSMAANTDAVQRAFGFEMRPNPTTQELVDLIAEYEKRSSSVVRNLTPEELAERQKIVQLHQAALNQARVSNLPTPEVEKMQIQFKQMVAGMGYRDKMVPRFFDNVHAVNTNGDGSSIGVRLNHPAGSLIQRRMKKLEPLATVLSCTEFYIKRLEAGKPSNRDGKPLLPAELHAKDLAEELGLTTSVTPEKETHDEEPNETVIEVPGEKEAWWKEFVDESMVSKPEEWEGDEPALIHKTVTPRPGFAPPPPEAVYVSAENEELRHLRGIAASFKNYHSAMREGLESEPGVPSERPHPAVVYPNLALSKLQYAPLTPRKDLPLFGNNWNNECLARMDTNGCTFCLYECDFGIYDARVLLPAEASTGYCWDCHTSCYEAPPERLRRQYPQVFRYDPKEAEFYKTQEELENMGMTITSHLPHQGLSEQLRGNPKDSRTWHDVNMKVQTSLAPLKEVGKKFGHAAQAEKFSSDAKRQQLMKQLHPGPVFRAAMEAGVPAHKAMINGRAADAPSRSIDGGSRVNANIFGASQNANRSMNRSPKPGSDQRQPESTNVGDRVNTNISGATHNINQSMNRSAGQNVPTALAPSFLLNRPPRPSPLAVVTDMSPMRSTFAPSTSTSNQQPRPMNNPDREGNSNITGMPRTASPDTEMPLAPLTGETFSHIIIPASPTSVSSFRQSSSRGSSQDLSNLDDAGPSRKRPRALSAIDGMDISDHKLPGFCRGNSWRQVDVLKARICNDCRYEKFYIIKHRHTLWDLVIHTEPIIGPDGNVVRAERRARSCMVCPGAAMFVCTGCPLRLCSGCQTMLRTQCKGWLNNLIYHYGRAHIRNDAFLLRSDGQGF